MANWVGRLLPVIWALGAIVNGVAWRRRLTGTAKPATLLCLALAADSVSRRCVPDRFETSGELVALLLVFAAVASGWPVWRALGIVPERRG